MPTFQARDMPVPLEVCPTTSHRRFMSAAVSFPRVGVWNVNVGTASARVAATTNRCPTDLSLNRVMAILRISKINVAIELFPARSFDRTGLDAIVFFAWCSFECQ